METIRINANQLTKKIGSIAPLGYKGHTVTSYAYGLPIKIATEMSQQDWDKFCDGELDNNDITRLKLCGIL